MALGSQVVL